MAKLFGWYGDETGKPTRIGVTCTPKESERLAGIPEDAKPYSGAPEHITHIYKPHKQTVGEIAKRVEVQCDDQRFIDWMAGKGRAS